jgi:hypothetical protein
MMKAFLDTLARFLTEEKGWSSAESCVVLPNRRAGMFLRRHLARRTGKVAWVPRIWSVNDFINELSLLKPADPVDIMFCLYDIYRELKSGPETLDEFWYWGEIMLRDFDELDKYLADPGMLFRNISDLKEIEEPLAGLEESQLSFISQFWKGFHEGSPTREKAGFLEIWKLLPGLYKRLREVLSGRGLGYPGMQYREIVARIGEGRLDFPDCDRMIIAGFNALNACEQKIFSWLREQGALFFWDYDPVYTGDPLSEAGRFMRGNLKLFPPVLEPETGRDSGKDQEIKIFELPTDVLQAKTVHGILSEKDRSSLSECTETAVILCDEELLMPVLLSIPEAAGDVNVTMGYPMSHTPVYTFLDALLRLQNNARKDGKGEEHFYHRDVRTILLHPYMEQGSDAEPGRLLQDMTRANLVRVERSRFTGTLEQIIFRSVEDAGDLVSYLREIFLYILEQMSAEDGIRMPGLHREFLFRILIHLNILEGHISTRRDLTLPVLQRLLRKIMGSIRVPFEGEPLSGLQVMGILETRLLDFRHVILLSMNEDVMPASHFRQSFIPYSLRLAFGMPSREDMDAIYAYYFHRLLQRAEKVDLLYNGSSEGTRTGEMSRYLHQLVYSGDRDITRPVMEIVARERFGLSVPHTEVISGKLRRYCSVEEGSKYLSPSAINTYLDCPLKFYLRYLERIGEPDRVTEEIDAAGFGSVVHDALNILYREIADRNGGKILKEDLETLKSSARIGSVLESMFIKHHLGGRKGSVIDGSNIIILRIMSHYVSKIVETDARIAPFTLVSAEKDYTREQVIRSGGQEFRIRIGGKIDRVDRLGEQLRVIDYKTGGASRSFPDLASLFDSGLANRNGAALQTLIYAWLVFGEYPEERVMPGLYVMKSLYETGFDPALVSGRGGEKGKVDSFASLEKQFMEHLGSLLEEIFDPASPFPGTEVESRCRYCDFAGMCGRTFIE